MNALLLNRELASSPRHEVARYIYRQQLHSLSPAPTRFKKASRDEGSEAIQISAPNAPPSIAHYGGVNAIEIDKFDGRFLLSGGADSTISVWDLETTSDTIKPLGTINRSNKGSHSFGITDVAFYPFDSAAFLSSSFDTNVKIYSSETLQAVSSFSLEAPVYAIALSPMASHVLVACGTQLPVVRLIDLRSGAASHSLAGHSGAVLSVNWSPTEEHILASGGSDGTVRFWDVRRSAGQLGVLDLEDSIGVLGYNGRGSGARHASRGKAHAAAVNGVLWTGDGRRVVTAGHDEKVRVWDVVKGANTLANFGPYIKNRQLSRLLPCLVPTAFTEPGRDVLLFPAEREILMYEIYEGQLLSRLRIPGASMVGGGNNALSAIRPKDLAWRAHNVEFYSAHADGSIRAWKPKVEPDDVEEDAEDEERKRKRKILNDIYNDVTKKRFTMNNESR